MSGPDLQSPLAASRDPLYAQVTPGGEGAIATFLLDGEGLIALFRTIFRSRTALDPTTPQQLLLGQLLDRAGGLVDEVVVAPIPARDSESGLERLELSSHGGRGVGEAVRAALEEAGIRKAQRYELETRAHLAGRLSLPALEARLRLPSASTARQVELLCAWPQLQSRWEAWGLKAALGIRQGEVHWREELQRAAGEDLRQAPGARRLLRVQRLAIAGPANAGKSTLANALLRAEESLTDALPGTTRDLVERPAVLRGCAVTLIDTAGLRSLDPASEPQTAIEREGQERALACAKAAEATLLVVDGSRAPLEPELALLGGLASQSCLLVLNKADLGLHPEAEGLAFALGLESLALSARGGAGLPELEAALERLLLGAESLSLGAPFTRRQSRCLERLQAALFETQTGMGLLAPLRDLVGTRPNPEALAEVYAEFDNTDGV